MKHLSSRKHGRKSSSTRKWAAVCAGLIAVLAWFTAVAATDEVPAQVQQAAEEGLVPMLRAIPSSDLQHYGFGEGIQESEVSLGAPYHVNTIDVENLLTRGNASELTSIIVPTEMWLFPVLTDGSSRCLLTVDRLEGTWKAVAIGASGLAGQLQQFTTAWNQEPSAQSQLVRVYQAHCDLMVVSSGDETGVVLLESAMAAIDAIKGSYDPTDVRAPSDVLQALIPVIEENIEMTGE